MNSPSNCADESKADDYIALINLSVTFPFIRRADLRSYSRIAHMAKTSMSRDSWKVHSNVSYIFQYLQSVSMSYTLSLKVKAGAILNVICTAVLLLANHTWGDAFFEFDVIPWATGNVTLTTPAT